MTTLSEKLHLPNWERIAYMVSQGESPSAEADRRATVDAVAQWIETGGNPAVGDDIRRELLAEEGEGDG